MTIQDLGSIGELVAAIATVVTLVYLAVQIRQNTKMIGASLAQAHRDARNDTTRFLATDPETARVYRHGLRDPDSLGDTPKQFREPATPQGSSRRRRRSPIVARQSSMYGSAHTWHPHKGTTPGQCSITGAILIS